MVIAIVTNTVAGVWENYLMWWLSTDSTGLDKAGLVDWMGLDRAGLDGAQWDWARLDWARLDGIG